MMCPLKCFLTHPCLFWLVALVSSSIHGVIGYFYQKNQVILVNEKFKDLKDTDRWWGFYIHDIIFNSVCNFSGFVALYFVYQIYNPNNLSNISGGTSAILVFLSIIALSGISGCLPSVLPSISRK
jgi:hypothetical protein